MQWSIFTAISKIPDFGTSMTATWLHTTAWGCSLIKVNWHFWQAQVLLLLFLPKDGRGSPVWQTGGPKVTVINPKDHFPVDCLGWCFLKDHSTSHMGQRSHNSSSGPFPLSCCLWWHQKFSVCGEHWKLQDFVEHVREEKRMWQSLCLLVWGALCTAISSPKGWNIFFAWHSLHFNRFPARRSHICAVS